MSVLDESPERKKYISDFYQGKNLLVTGGSGFLGKILIEKILRTCNQVNKVYMLVRPKKNRSIEERVAKLFESVVRTVKIFIYEHVILIEVM